METREKERVGKIEMIPVHELVPYDKNPRKHDKSLPQLIESIKKFGFTQPIIIDQNNRIVAGHGRHKAANQLRLMTVPCVRVELTDAEYIQLVLADNKITEMSKWDNKLLKDCMEILEGMQIELTSMPAFEAVEIDKIFGHHHQDVSASDDAEADFGDGVKVKSEGDDRALVFRKVFMLTKSEHDTITRKLKAIKKEHGLDTEAEAFIKSLEPYKALPKVTKKAGPVKNIEVSND